MPTPQITALPPPPSRNDPSTFADKADAFLGALPLFSTEANSLALDANSNAVTATTQAGVATTKASEASASAASSLASQVLSAEWASKTTGTVNGTEFSAREWATGVIVPAGSAREWATQVGSTVDGTEFSAKHYANTAAGILDQFDDRYLGSNPTNPTLDNDGNPLLIGALYWNSSVNTMRVYNGTAWQTAVGTLNAEFGIVRSVVIASAGQTVFTVPQYSVGTNSIMIYRNGIRLVNSEYVETSNTSITLNSPAALNDRFLFEIGVVTTGGVTSAALTTFTPQGSVSSNNVQAAIVELDSDLTVLANAPKFPDFILFSQGVV